MEFSGEMPENWAQKCLLVLTLDTSGSMSGTAINQLNAGLRELQNEILKDMKASQSLEVAIVSYNSVTKVIQQPSLINETFQMPTLVAEGGTNMCDGLNKAIELVNSHKIWYKQTGQVYYRPIIVHITDGQPDSNQDINYTSSLIKSGIANKAFTFWQLGVQGYNHAILERICDEPVPLPLDGYNFSNFFKWLSASIAIIAKSKEGDVLALPSPQKAGWTQLAM